MLNRVSCVVVVILALAVPANGQVANAEVNGTGVDQTGSLLPGVTISITEESTGLVRTTAANEKGRL